MSPQRFAVFAVLSVTLALNGWVAVELAGLGSPGGGSRIAVDTPPVEIAERIDAALADLREVLPPVRIASASTPDPVQNAVEASALSVEVVGIGHVADALPDPREVLPPERMASASTPDPVQNAVEASALSVEVVGIGHVADALPDPREVLPPERIASASTPDPVQTDVEAPTPSVEVAEIGSVGAALLDPGETMPPAAPPARIASADTPDPVQNNVEASGPPVEVTEIGSVGAALPDPGETMPPALRIASASTPDPVQDNVEASAVEVTEPGSVGAALPDPRETMPPALQVASASTPDPVQNNVEASAVEVTEIGSVGAALPDPRETMPPALQVASASTPDPVQNNVEASAVEATETASAGAALPEPHETMPTAKPPVRLVSLFRPAPVEEDLKPVVRLVETPNECLVAEICIDDFLWSFYERTPKVDTNKMTARIKATVRKKGKTRTVMRTIAKYVVADFTWKDPIAAQRVSMSVKDYVIGGMDRRFKLKLYYALRAMDDAGLMPGITSAFRDDYRQAIASGNKAASDSSYHGGSRRGGYGHGLAADLVSVKGETRLERFASSVELWKWIDAREKELGIARPYLNRDPPHVGPIDGLEYAAKRGGAKARLLRSAMSRRHQAAVGGSSPSVTKPATKAVPVRVGSL